MGDVIPLKSRKGTAREQVLEMAMHQARVQGKSLVQYLKELQVQAEHRGAGDTAPQRVPARVPRERYVYLTRREVDLLFDRKCQDSESSLAWNSILRYRRVEERRVGEE